jgi:hypothetical protein
LPGTFFEDLRRDRLFKSAEAFARRTEAARLSRHNPVSGLHGTDKPQIVPGSPSDNVIPLFRNAPPGIADLYSPQMLDQIQRQLRLAGEGISDPNKAALARTLRQEFLDRIQRHYPSFKGIRERYAEGKAAQEALDAGRSFLARHGQSADEMMAGFRGMSPTEKQLFLLGHGQHIRDMLANKQPSHDLTAALRTPGAKSIYQELLGNKKGSQFVKDVEEEHAITNAGRFLTEGSRTTPLAQAQKKLMENEQIVADALTMSPHHMLRHIAARLARHMAGKNSAEIIKMLTTHSEPEMMQALQEIEAAQGNVAKQKTHLFGPTLAPGLAIYGGKRNTR